MSDEQQLEFFDLPRRPIRRTRHELGGTLSLRLRYDHLLLGLIGGLLSTTVIFACGIERGKRVARLERAFAAHETPTAAPAEPIDPRASAASSTNDSVAANALAQEGFAKNASPVAPATATRPATRKPSVKVASSSVDASMDARASEAQIRPASVSRYAIQVVTYSQPQLAKKELARLTADGERGFLLMRNSHTVVYVGPFPSKLNATEKLALLRRRYQDCFVKTL